jgi:hypothetical protein
MRISPRLVRHFYKLRVEATVAGVS